MTRKRHPYWLVVPLRLLLLLMMTSCLFFESALGSSSSSSSSISNDTITTTGSCLVGEEIKCRQQHQRQGSVTGISTSENSDHYMEFLPCLDSLPESLVPFMESYRKKTREPPFTTLSCCPSSCFRVVLDGYDHLLDSHVDEDGSVNMTGLDVNIQSVFYENNLVPMSSVECSFSQKQTHTGRSNVNKGSPSMHVDYFSSAKYVVTAILYDEPSEGIEGGETCFADACGEDNQLQAGLLVEPKRGRLLLFSAGGENLHGRMPITSDPGHQRPFYIFFFQCRQQDNVEEGIVADA